MIGKQFGLFGLRKDYKFNQSHLLGRIVAIKNDGFEMMTGHGVEVIHGDYHLGDFIRFSENGQNIQVEEVIPAYSKLTISGHVVTNVDTVVLVISSESTDFTEVEAELNHVWDSGALPVIAIVNPAGQVSHDLLMNVRRIAAFVDIFVVDSVSDGSNLKRVFKENKTTLLLGSTNAVKEYLLERLYGDTFTLSDQIVFEYQQMAIMTINSDTEAIDINEDDLYQDIEDLVSRCRFNDCTHTNEPGCQIIEALENGSLSYDRYESYLESKATPELEDTFVLKDEDDDRYYNYRRRSRDKSKFTKKNNKDKEEFKIY